MLRSNEACCLSADDISVRCTVRHVSKCSSSSSDSNNNGDQNQRQHTSEEDMTCTMRVWHKMKQPRARLAEVAAAAALGQKTKQQTPSKTKAESATGLEDGNGKEQKHDIEKAGPELVLTPNMRAGLLVEQQQHLYHHQPQHQQHLCCGDSFGGGDDTPRIRFSSFGSSSFDAPGRRYSLSNGDQVRPRRIGNVTLPLDDILLIDVNGNSQTMLLKKKEHQLSSSSSPEKNSNNDLRIYIITISNGLYEFTMESTNGRELLLAFLKANLPKERFNDQGIPRSPSNVTHDTSYSNRSFDVEAFTANRMAERLKSESIGEKVQRRVHRLVTNFEELSCAITECAACGCGHAAVSPAPQHELNVTSTEKGTRDFPPGRHQVVEMAPDETPRLSRPSVAFKDKPMENSQQPDRSDALRNSQLLSGLSVESDTEMD